MKVDVVIKEIEYEGADKSLLSRTRGLIKGPVRRRRPSYLQRLCQEFVCPWKKTSRKRLRTSNTELKSAASCSGNGLADNMGGAFQWTAPDAFFTQALPHGKGTLGGVLAQTPPLCSNKHTTIMLEFTQTPGGSVINERNPIAIWSKSKGDLNLSKLIKILSFALQPEMMKSADRNGIIDAGQIGCQASTKNCITVSASENDPPEITWQTCGPIGFTTKPLRHNRVANNPWYGMADFTPHQNHAFMIWILRGGNVRQFFGLPAWHALHRGEAMGGFSLGSTGLFWYLRSRRDLWSFFLYFIFRRRSRSRLERLFLK